MSIEGILGNLLANSGLKELNIIPQLKDKDIVISISEDQLKQILLKNVNPAMQNNIDIKIENKQIILKIRLF